MKRHIVLIHLALTATSLSLVSASWSEETSVQAEQQVSSTATNKDEDARREAALRAIRYAADTISITRDDEEIKRVEKPAFVYEDTLRSSKDGSVWVWGDKGRPEAVVAMYRYSNSYWLYELASFNSTPFNVDKSRRMKEPCEFLPVATDTKPSKSAKLRKSQIRLLAKKFRAFQMWDNDRSTELQRYELRLSAPVHEYQDAERNVLSGSVFLFNYGSNPELALIIEATTDGWQCAFGRLGWASASVTFDGKDFYEQPKMSNSSGDPRYLMRQVEAKRTTRTANALSVD